MKTSLPVRTAVNNWEAAVLAEPSVRKGARNAPTMTLKTKQGSSQQNGTRTTICNSYQFKGEKKKKKKKKPVFFKLTQRGKYTSFVLRSNVM